MTKTIPLPAAEETFIPSSSIHEAKDRLSQAAGAFNAFMCLLSGTESVNPEELYWLLLPIQGEIDAALDELNTISTH